MLEHISDDALLALVGGFGGLMLGLAARLGRFCTLGAIEDLLYGQSAMRARMWGIAIGVAVIGTFGLAWAGLLSLEETLYLSRGWNPMASVLGGLLFGYGMALAGNCGFGALARLGGGDMRSFVIVLVMGVSAYVALGGPLSSLRMWLFDPFQTPDQLPSLAALVARSFGGSMHGVGVLLGLGILMVTFWRSKLLRAPASVFWGAIVGLAIVSGWAGSQWISNTGFAAQQVLSHTFSAPIGETILYTMTSSGNSVSFGTGSVCGVLLGAFIGSLSQGHFRWEACEDPRELRRQILGAFLMGVGAVVAIGCSVGQGLSAFSVLAYSAPVTAAAILAGAALGLRQLIVGFALRS